MVPTHSVSLEPRKLHWTRKMKPLRESGRPSRNQERLKWAAPNKLERNKAWIKYQSTNRKTLRRATVISMVWNQGKWQSWTTTSCTRHPEPIISKTSLFLKSWISKTTRISIGTGRSSLREEFLTLSLCITQLQQNFLARTIKKR